MTGRSRWKGGASVRLRSAGMLNMPRPFGTLTVTSGTISLVVRPAFLSGRLPGNPWRLNPDDHAVVFPVRGSAFKRGVGFERPSEKPYYFWCGRALPDVLKAIEAAGFPIEMIERRPEFR
jgi:hypothetical protein